MTYGVVMHLAEKLGRRLAAVTRAALGLTEAEKRTVFDDYLREAPSPQGAVDIFRGEWISRLPPPFEDVKAGELPLFEDGRLLWLFDRLGGLTGNHVLELGPLEGGHTYMTEHAGAASVLAIEANARAFLRCLLVKELLSLTRARFLCGDFVEWLRSTDQRFDVCIASGVLYHMRQPVELLELIAKVADAVFIWTHYYDRDRIESAPDLGGNFQGEVVAEHGGFAHTLHRHMYGPSPETGFCGGNHGYSMWLEREDILSALRHFGFSEIEVGLDVHEHQNGPNIALIARVP